MAKQENRPTLPLLPDLDNEVELTQGLGLQAAENLLAQLAEKMDAPECCDSADVLAVVRRAEDHLARRSDEAAWRGLLALTLLWDTWADVPGQLRVRTISGDTAFSAMLLAARRPGDRQEPLRLVTLEKPGHTAVLGLAHKRLGVVPAATRPDLTELLSERVIWYGEEGFRDPSECLNERDRATLIYRLGALSGEPVRRFAAALMNDGLRFSRALAAGEQAEQQRLCTQAMAVCGLRDFPQLTCREERYRAETEPSPLLAALELETPVVRELFAQQLTWLWQGVPFARSCAATGVESAWHPQENAALTALAEECALLEGSLRWQRNTARQLDTWLREREVSRSFSPAAKELLRETQGRMDRESRDGHRSVRLQWPWQEDSAAVAYLLQEQIGERFAKAGQSPFADRLTILPDAAPDALGDPLLCHACALPMDDTGMPCLVLPPLSAELGKALSACPEALEPSSLAMSVTEMGAVEASFTLRGDGEINFIRVYPPEEIELMQPEETPTVAVWPSVAFPAEQWRAYHVYTNGIGVTVSVLRGNEWIPADEHLWSTLRTEQFPVCLMVHRGGVCLGALLNLLPVFRTERTDNAIIAMDLGMSGTAVAIRQGSVSEPMEAPCLVRTLLHGAKPVPFAEEFMPVEPVRGVLPSVAALFRDCAEPLPLVDGHTGGAEQAGSVYTALKWRADEQTRKACRLHLHQTMMTAALCAKMRGAGAVSWRMALPADLSPSACAALVEEVQTLARVVAEEACLPLTTVQPPVRCMDADMALSAYLKGSGYQRGGFLAMDVGAGSAEMMLWLRGMSRPCAVTHLPLGIQAMVLNTLMLQPETLEADFAALPDAAAQRDVAELAQQLRAARGSRKALERCRLLLDECLGRHLPSLEQHMARALQQGEITLLQSLLLCGFAWLMASAGLQVERAWQDATVNDHLPMDLPLCLTGRGSLLLAGMPELITRRLTHFLRLGMRQDNAVQQIQLTAPQQPKLEIALGLARAADGLAETAADAPSLTDDGAAVPSALLFLRRFLMAFHAEFPQAFDRLYPGLIQQGQLTDEAERRICALVDMQPSPTCAALAACLEQLRLQNN